MLSPARKFTYSVVIPTLNEENYISYLLSDLQKQTYKPSEIIIVDGKSDDETVERIGDRATLIVSKKRSAGYQRNLGSRMANGDVICFLDADVRIGKSFFNRALAEMREKNIAIACPYYAMETNSLIVKIFEIYINFIFRILQFIQPSGAGPCILIRKSVFRKEKKFSSHLKFQDIEYVRRVGRKNRFRIISESITTSDRRFRESGVLTTLTLYFVISFLFFFNLFSLTNIFTYKLGSYKN